MRRTRHVSTSSESRIHFQDVDAYMQIEDGATGHVYDPCRASDGRVWIAVPYGRAVFVVANATGTTSRGRAHDARFTVTTASRQVTMDTLPFRPCSVAVDALPADGEDVGHFVCEWQWTERAPPSCRCLRTTSAPLIRERQTIHFTTVPEALRNIVGTKSSV